MATHNVGRRKRFSWFRFLGKSMFYLVILLISIGAAGALGVYLVYDHVTQPGTVGVSVDVEVPSGSTGRDVGHLLAEHDLIDHEIFFRIAVRLEPTKGAIKFGRYRLPKGLSPVQLLERLQAGPESMGGSSVGAEQFRITVPEGLSVTQASKLFENPQAYIDAAADADLIAEMELDAVSLEGFLMPNTYFFSGPPTEGEVVVRMLDQFRQEYEALTADSPPPDDRSVLEIVTIASLVEEESRVDEERPIVASVIYNRLNRNMALEMDSTLQFALGKYGQRILYEDKEIESPYNTYKHADLPPGPISSPGVASLRAALNPADTKFLYFVSNADGRTHTFSRTIREHNAAVSKYRRESARQRREAREAQQE